MFTVAGIDVTTTHVILVLELILLEGLLSFDNALALAALVKSRLDDPSDQRRALVWGIWGAYILRILIVFIGVWLMQYEWVKAAAGIYLIWLAVSELFLSKHNGDENKPAAEKGPTVLSRRRRLIQTIIAVEMMDLMFSIDSIGVALAISDVKWVLVTGAVLGILMMRVAAQVFVRLIEHFPVLVKTAFILVGIAGVNVVLKLKDLPLGFTTLTIDKAIPETPFLTLLIVVLVGSMALNKLFPAWFSEAEKS